ncbi:MAG TPA: proline dehydrogenase family protein, partial [Terriglobia bacterium]|nr:proline dehydrogenase family protein [Terriglobia bacterium]
FTNLKSLIARERPESVVWIDMEASQYVDATLELYRRALAFAPNVGICLQAYLRRTRQDFDHLLPLRPSIRLVKGAYKEPPAIAFPRKAEVDENYFALARQMLAAKAEGKCQRIACGTHDAGLIRRITDFAAGRGLPKSEVEIQMLFGIQRGEQERLAREGYRSGVLVAYGSYWYPWFVRRLAERPANLWFVVRNVFAG